MTDAGGAYLIEYAQNVPVMLKELRPFDKQRLLDRIEERLRHRPLTATRNRRPLPGLEPSWAHEGPVWQLRVEEWRVFYDVVEAERRVVIRAIRRKPPHSTTEQVI